MEDDFIVVMYGRVVPVHRVEKSNRLTASGDRGGLEIDVARTWKRERGGGWVD